MAALTFLCLNLIAQEQGLFKDKRDGRTYGTIKIAKQVWMTDNLDVVTFRNGDTIPEAKTQEDWERAGEEKKAAWCYYKNDPSYGPTRGKLYNCYAVIDERGLAPKGWHIATKADWEMLAKSLGGTEELGLIKFKSEQAKLASVQYQAIWGSVSGGRMYFDFGDEAGFVGSGIEKYSTWWNGPLNKKSSMWQNYFQYRYTSKILNHVMDCRPNEGHSIRCVKN